jgi:predicted acylesterase/phospholipase RssA
MRLEVSPGDFRAVTPGRQAVVLSGGGSYAAYEVGVLKALLGGYARVGGGRPVRLDLYTGTSAGSINAAFMVSRSRRPDAQAVAELEDFWLEVLAGSRERCAPGAVRYRFDPRDLLNPACLTRDASRPLRYLAEDSAYFAGEVWRRATNFVASDATLERRLVELFDVSAFLSLASLRRILREHVPLAEVRTSPCVLRVASTNWTTGELHLFGNADMTDEVGHDAIQASATFPGLPPVAIRGELYVDGGYVMNTPLKPAIDAGGDTLHVVYLDPDVQYLPVRRFYNAVDTLDKLYAIMMAAIFNRDIEWANDINAGLKLLGGADGPGPVPDDRLRGFLRTASRIRAAIRGGAPYRKITIHRYRPHEDLGGVVGILNFEHDHLEDLIARGFRDAVEHNCFENGCAMPVPADAG